MASIVDRPATKPDCCGWRVASSSGCSRANSTCANTFPGTESRVIGLQLLHSDLEPFPLQRATKIPSLQSDGTRPVLQTWQNRECSARETGPMAHFRSSGGIPSGPAARPLRSFEMARVTSSKVGSSVDVSVQMFINQGLRQKICSRAYLLTPPPPSPALV